MWTFSCTCPRLLAVLLLSISPIYGYLKASGCAVEGERIVIGDWPVQFSPPRGALEQEVLDEAVETKAEGLRTWGLM